MPDIVVNLPRTLAEFAAAPAELLAHLKATGKGRRLQVDGGSTVVVVDEEVFKKLRQEEERAALLEGLLDVAEGRVRPAEGVFGEPEAEMREYLRQAKEDIRAGDVVDAREFVQALGTPGGPKL